MWRGTLPSRSRARGLPVTGYALGVVIGGPVLAALTAKVDRRKALLMLIGIFILGNALCALAPGYGLMMAARWIFRRVFAG
jgi:DHA1 family inner membrane transport protein